MPSFLREHSVAFIALGTGVVLGAGVTLVVRRLTSHLNQDLSALAVRLENLCQEVHQLKSDLDSIAASKKQKRHQHPGYYSVHASSGEDDDDLFEEAYDRNEFGGFPSQKLLTDVTSNSLGELETSLDEAQLFAKVDKWLDYGTDGDKQKALDLLSAKEQDFLTNCGFRWRLAKATYLMSQVEGGKGNAEGKKSLIYKSHDLAEQALQLDSEVANCHKWFAISLGSIGDYESIQVKITNGYTFRQHIQKAIEIEPEDAVAHYLLGRWCYGVYMLSWMERKVASTLFAAPPTATVDEALQEFMEADRLQTAEWKENLLYVAKCYIEKRDYYTCMDWLNKANSVPTVSADDREAQTEVDSLLYKYSGYGKRS